MSSHVREWVNPCYYMYLCTYVIASDHYLPSPPSTTHTPTHTHTHTHTHTYTHIHTHTHTHAHTHTHIQCLEFLINAGVSPQNNGFIGIDINFYDNNFETSLNFSEDVPPPPSLLHQAVLCQCGHGEGVRGVAILEMLLPLLKDELESVDSQGKERGEGRICM